MKRLVNIAFVIALIVCMGLNVSYARFADFDDETAEQEAKKMQEEQEKAMKENIGKSTNNYLEKLEVEGFKISPDFDKQTINYEIKVNKDTEYITINAQASDKEAKTFGIGKIKLENGKQEYRVDVTAPSGTVRTYFIKVVGKEDVNENVNQEAENQEEQVEAVSVDEGIQNEIVETEKQEKEENRIKDNKNIIITFILIAICLCVIIGVALAKFSKKSKH